MVVCQIADLRRWIELRRILRYHFTGCVVNKDSCFAVWDGLFHAFAVAVVKVFADCAGNVAASVNRFDLDLFILGVICEFAVFGVAGRVARTVEQIAVQAVIRRIDRWIHDRDRFRADGRVVIAKLWQGRRQSLVEITVAVAVIDKRLFPTRRSLARNVFGRVLDPVERIVIVSLGRGEARIDPNRRDGDRLRLHVAVSG